MWDAKISGIKKNMRSVREGQIRLKFFSAVFFPWVNLKKIKWTDYDVFDWEDKDGRVLFFLQNYFRSQWT